jgi:hypothetical protein
MTQLERDIESALVGMVKQHDGLCLKWVCPGRSGVPDRIILLPGGHIIFVETKRPKGGRVDPLQLWWREKLKSLGFRHYIIKNETDINTLEEVLR